MIKAIIFDMDGLLIDSEPLWREAEITVFKSIGLDFTEEMCRQTMGMRIDEVVQFWHNKFKWDFPSLNHVSEAIIDELIRLVTIKGIALPGVLSVLEEFKRKSIPMAIASSSSMKIIETVIKKLEITPYFKVIHSAENEKYGKPHPQVFISTAKKLGIKPENCLVFEDSKFGMLAGLSAKMNVIIVPENPKTHQDWHLIATQKLNSLEEFSL